MNTRFEETSFYDALGCVVIRLDRQMNLWFMNRCGLDLLGYERLGQIFGKPFSALLPDDDTMSAELLAIIDTLPRQIRSEPVDSDLLHCSGTRLPMSWHLNYQDKAGEQMAGDHVAPTVLVGFDARPVRRSQAAAQLFQTVSDNYSGSILITDPQRTILYANPALLQMTGYAGEDLLGNTPSLFSSGETDAAIYRNLWETLNAGGIWQGEFINRRQDGEHYLESKTISAIRDTRGAVQYYFAIGEDISQRQRYQQRIERLLAFDEMTGLPNRSTFLRALHGVLESANRNGKEVTVLHVDIDDFFDVNEALGPHGADQAIAETATRIKDALRQDDQLARLGNDKFAILLGPHEQGIDNDIREVSERILAVIRKPLGLPEQPLCVTASIGIAAYPADCDTASDLLSHAMNATERIKSSGGNSFCRFDASMASRASGQRDLLMALRQAIDLQQLVLHFQPQVSLFSGSIIGLEALIRWQHPQRGLIGPGEFIPLIEQNQLIIDIGDWVLREACRQLRVWLDAGLPPVKVAINLAAHHFHIPTLHTTIAGTLSEYRLPPRLLEIEITESAMMQDVAAAIRSTAQLKEIGVRLSLDDFGTGYSSLAYLSRFPIDVVKIDQSFVRDITTNPANAAIAQATIAMSHKLGKVVLAEGVETEEQMHYLRRNECDEMQGYFFSKPLPAADITRLLQENSTMNFAGPLDPAMRSTVLFVDDEANILSSLKRTLRREGYDILTAENATDGFSLLARNTVQVVVSDQRMPEMNGTEFLARVKTLYPETVRMVLSGYSEISAVTDSINKGAVYRFMLKPWDDDKLKAEITGALRYWRELYGAKADKND